jgi:hypothetical protein
MLRRPPSTVPSTRLVRATHRAYCPAKQGGVALVAPYRPFVHPQARRHVRQASGRRPCKLPRLLQPFRSTLPNRMSIHRVTPRFAECSSRQSLTLCVAALNTHMPPFVARRNSYRVTPCRPVPAHPSLPEREPPMRHLRLTCYCFANSYASENRFCLSVHPTWHNVTRAEQGPGRYRTCGPGLPGSATPQQRWQRIVGSRYELCVMRF